MTKQTNAKLPPIHNPELEKVIADLKQGNTPEKQVALVEALKKANLLSPCDFDAKIDMEKDNLQSVHPSQIKFYLLNTKDGKTLFPAFTEIEQSKHMKFGEGIEPKYVVRALKDFDVLLNLKDAVATGIVINPGTDNIVIPKQLIAVALGKMTVKKPVVQNVPMTIKYGEPTVYPTKMVNAVYERAEETEEIKKVYLKGKFIGNQMHFLFVVEATKQEEAVLNKVREVSVPLSKGIEVEVVFLNDELKEKVIKDDTPLYDAELTF